MVERGIVMDKSMVGVEGVSERTGQKLAKLSEHQRPTSSASIQCLLFEVGGCGFFGSYSESSFIAI